MDVFEIDILTKNKNIKTVIWNSANVFDKGGERWPIGGKDTPGE